MLEASATCSPSPMVVGINYRRLASINSIYSNTEQTTSAYANALVDPSTNLFTTYSFPSDYYANGDPFDPCYTEPGAGIGTGVGIGNNYQRRTDLAACR